MMCICVFVDNKGFVRTLQSRVNYRIKFAYKNKTWEVYKKMLLTLLAFCVFIDIDITDIEHHTFIMFLEFLVANNLKTASIYNYVSGIKTYMKWLSLPIKPLEHFRVSQSVSYAKSHQ